MARAPGDRESPLRQDDWAGAESAFCTSSVLPRGVAPRLLLGGPSWAHALIQADARGSDSVLGLNAGANLEAGSHQGTREYARWCYREEPAAAAAAGVAPPAASRW